MFILAYLVFIRQTTTRRWCSLFNADLALSVTMTAISTILSTVMLPLNLLLYTSFAFGHDSDDVIQMIDFTALFVSLAVVIGAIGLGILLTDRIDSFNFSVHANRVSTRKIGILCITSSSNDVSTPSSNSTQNPRNNFNMKQQPSTPTIPQNTARKRRWCRSRPPLRHRFQHKRKLLATLV